MAGLVLLVGVAASLLLATWTFRVATRYSGNADRRMLVLFAMTAPALVLGVLLGGSLAMVAAGCPWFTPLDHTIVATVAGCFLSFLAIACLRHYAQGRRVRRDLLAISEPVAAGPLFEELGRVADRLGVPRPELRMARTAESLACSLGVRRPLVVLSTGLVERLDDREREAVLAHELAHVKQHDHLVGFLIAWLRDSLFYMPTAREGWEHYRHDREIACDALSASATGRPGALASALFKVSAPPGSAPEVAAHFGQDSSQLEARLSHLLGDVPTPRAGRAAVGYGILVVGVMATILALSPVWYMPVCMTLFCRIGG